MFMWEFIFLVFLFLGGGEKIYYILMKEKNKIELLMGKDNDLSVFGTWGGRV